MIVTSFPSVIKLPLPIGIKKSVSWGTLDFSLYRSSCSRKITGLGFLIEVLSNPFASLAFEGATTIKPGIWENHEMKHWLCWAATLAAAPFGPRKTIGTLISPPDM